MELTNELRNKVDLVLDNFDFDKVARVMGFLDWKYYGEADTPHKAELIQLARRLLWVLPRKPRMLASGMNW